MANPSSSDSAKTASVVKFKVIVPNNVKPGQVLRIRCPDGTEGDVKVPRGAKPGGSFIFEMPADALVDATRGMAGAGGGAATSSGGGGGGHPSSSNAAGSGGNANNSSGRRRNNASSGNAGMASDRNAANNNDALSGYSGNMKGKSFLDREIVDRQDFLTALAVGILIGLSIVGGFLVGVIIATEPN